MTTETVGRVGRSPGHVMRLWHPRSAASRIEATILRALLAVVLVCAAYACILLAYELHPAAALAVIALVTASLSLHACIIPGRRGLRWQATLGLRLPPRKTLPWLGAAAIILVPYHVLVGEVGARLTQSPPVPVPGYRYAGLPLGMAVVVFSILIATPVVEELVFRGYALHAIGRVIGRNGALLFTSCLFGLMHGTVAWLPIYAFAGLLFGLAVLATRSVWPAIGMHTVANAAGLLVSGRQPPAWSIRFLGGAALWPVTACLAAAVLVLLWRANRSRLRAAHDSCGPLAPAPTARRTVAHAHHHCS